ncbi:hypothetical protein VCRA2118O236_40279 [Vibrio crassostreae]|nr:hypothetical protein VCRA2118O236_40279 [Vibrio crassostreae]CAK3226858.1 hypothetical protein VCRA2128O309_240029 [Vibrio crassostreae]
MLNIIFNFLVDFESDVLLCNVLTLPIVQQLKTSFSPVLKCGFDLIYSKSFYFLEIKFQARENNKKIFI